MPRVFLLLSDGGPTGAATQARLALAGLPHVDRDTSTATVRHALDFNALNAVRGRIARVHPDVLHVVGSGAVRSAALLKLPRVGVKPFPRLVVSGCDSPDGWLARRGLARADAVLAYSPGEAGRYRAYVRAERIHLIPPGIFVRRDAEGSATVARAPLRVAANPREVTIAAVGNFDRWSGLKTAVWAFDLLKYLSPEFHLLLIGDGPDREAVDRFGRTLGYDDYRVRFAGLSADVPAWLAAADVVWIAHERGGVSVTLEAMAAGMPVVAMRTSDTESVVRDGETGLLVPPGDRAALAAATAELLKRPDDLRRLGETARRVAAERFPPHQLAKAVAAVYDVRN